MIGSGFTVPEGAELAQEGEDRRRHRRFHCAGDAELRSLVTGLRFGGKICNLSVGGCLMQMADTRLFRRGEALEITFCVRQLPVRVQGSVRQVHPGQGIGVEFRMLSERGKRQLLELIEELNEVLRDQIDGLAGAKARGATDGAKDGTGLAQAARIIELKGSH